MNLTNYELLFCPGKVEKECGGPFYERWWKPMFARANPQVFHGPADDDAKAYWAEARRLHAVWHGLWEAKGRPYGDLVSGGDVDFGLWLAKRADVALLVPAGRPVRYDQQGGDGEDVFGMTLEPTLQVFSGNYSVEQVHVETDKGACTWPVDRVEPVRIPASVLAFAKAQALKDFGCPLLKGE